MAVEVGDRERPTVSGALEAGAGVWKPPLLEDARALEAAGRWRCPMRRLHRCPLVNYRRDCV